MALTAFSPGFMKRLTAPLVFTLAVVAGGLGGGGGLALAQTASRHILAEATHEEIEGAIDLLENHMTVAPENRCAPYDPQDYSDDSRDLQAEADLDPIVALSEAHDSGACAWSSEKKRAFTKDPENHELARAGLNREEKQGKDWAEWQPSLDSANFWNWCFAATRIVQTKWGYKLTVDQAEYDALVSTLARCLDFYATPAPAQAVGWN